MPFISIQIATETANSLLSFFSKEIRSLAVDEFKHKLRNTKKAKLIDISSNEEYKELHIPGSVNYDIQSPEFYKRLDNMDRNRPYFIYCRNGQHSEAATKVMEEKGFRRVYSLTSGLQSWIGTLERSY